MNTAVSRPLSSFHQINQWKMFNAKRLGITVEEFDQRIEEKRQEYKRQQEAKAAEQVKKASEARKRRNYEDAVFNGKFAGTFEEYKCKFAKHARRYPLLSEEEKKLHNKNYARKRYYAAAVEKGKFSGTFEEYCQRLDMTPEERVEAHKTSMRKRYYAAAVEKGKFSGTFEEYCQHLNQTHVKRDKLMTPEEKAEVHRIVARNTARKRAYAAAVEKGKFSGTFEEYCQHLEHLREMTPEEKAEYKAASKKAIQRRHYHKCKYQCKYQKLVAAGYEIGTLEEFSRTLEEASRLKKLLREISKAEKVA